MSSRAPIDKLALATRSDLAIASRGLTKRIGDRTIIDRIDLEIPRGAISGFVGPNGAGKTTTIRMLLGLVRPTAGTACVLGHSIAWPERYLHRVGALIEGPAFTPALSGRANLRVLARLGRIPSGRVDGALEQVGLAGRANDPYRSYSLGMKQRLGIAAALLPDAQLVILDEPTNGLDPAGMVEVRELLRALAAEGRTVLVSSHLLGELEHICDHLVMIRNGQVVFQGTTTALFDTTHSELLVRPEHFDDVGKLLDLCAAAGHSVRIVDDTLHISGRSNVAAELNRLAMDHGITLVCINDQRTSLESAFFELTSGDDQLIDQVEGVLA